MTPTLCVVCGNRPQNQPVSNMCLPCADRKAAEALCGERACPCADPTLCGTVDPALLAGCPRCGVLVEDLDGFGVLAHDACGYCSHADRYGGVCTVCGDNA